MSGIARILLGRGVPVSGSDAKDSAGLAELRALGGQVYTGHAAENLGDAQTVVISTAIRTSNPELLAATEAGLRILHRSEALAAAMAEDTVVAVAGTHGKTTTTSMITVLLREAGLDPSFAIGATVPALGVNAASGSGGIFIAEADESDGSFLNYQPQIAVLTNAEPDHLDHYGTGEAVMQAFTDFIGLLPADGLLVACADDAGSAALAAKAAESGTRVRSYGRAPGAEVRLVRDRLEFEGQSFELRLNVPGEYNALNAAAAFAVAVELGVAAEIALAGLAKFTGAARRFELKGEIAGVRVFDDYAHHPTELRAALTAARTVAGDHRVHVLFQPHLFSRTREFAAEFAQALELADTAIVLDIFPAREDPIAGVSSELITAQTPKAELASSSEQGVTQVVSQAGAGDIILTIGAGDVTRLGADILAALELRSKELRSSELRASEQSGSEG